MSSSHNQSVLRQSILDLTTDAENPVVSIIVVSFNTRQMTLDCLRSVKDQTTTAFEVIVLDNSSSDGSADAIAREFPEMRLIAETENLGFARANNVAAKEARGEYILLLNPDTVVLDSAIDKLVSFARSVPSAKIWGGRTVYGDGSLNATCCFQRMTLWKAFCRATGITSLLGNHRFVSTAYGRWQMDDSRPVDIITGCFLLIRRQLWNQLCGFDLTFFMFGEEADLCVRATRDFGARPHFTHEAQIVHYGGASETVRAERIIRLLNAQITFVDYHFPVWQKRVGKAFVRMIPFSRLLITSFAAKVTRCERFRAAADSWKEVWSRRPEWRRGYVRE